ncbi:APC family permease [Peterkaempfera bronchialis]|uniref:APC family permease n=1 Tax=Peterkaempfera bronchialis TaxID=2126346 RepID=A0A345SRA2_9ACTN|nr:APC family permease [Peterkaempfera bronchialis]AXI76257.1 APC family permease [Peterkaempfera bronchialis]
MATTGSDAPTAPPSAPAPHGPRAAKPPSPGDTALTSSAIGVSDLVFFVVAAAAPLTAVAGVAPAAMAMGGLATPLGYILSGGLLALFAAGFTAMSLYVRNAGAFYAYVARGLGKATGVGTAYVAVLSYNLVEIGLVACFGFFASGGVRDLTGFSSPWWLWSAICIAGVGALGWLRVTLSAKVLGLALVLEVVVLLILEGGVLGHRGTAALDFTALNPTSLGGAGVAGMFVLAIGAFTGFEATAIYAEEARDPRRTVPRATFVAVGFLAVFYAFAVWVVMGAYGAKDAVRVAQGSDGSDLVFNAAGRFVGSWLSDSMHVLIITSAFAATLAFHNAAARYLYALGREGLLPRRLGRVSPRSGSPGTAVAMQSLVAAAVIAVGALSGADPYAVVFLWPNGTGVLGIMAMQALAALAVFGFFRRDRRGVSAFRAVWAPLLSCLGISVLTVLAAIRFDLLTGASGAINLGLVAPIPVVFCLGLAVARHIRRTDPQRYAQLTTVDVERD